MADDNDLMQVEVVYAYPGNAYIHAVKVAPVTTIKEAIVNSGILQQCPEIDLEIASVGIFSTVKKLHDHVADGDRIEIYRALLADPKEARRARAKKQKSSQN